MTVTNYRDGSPERDWKDNFAESPPDFGEDAAFEEAVARFIRPPETFTSLFDGRAHERGGISFRLAAWWREEHPEPGLYFTDTIAGYVGLAPCRLFFEVRNEQGGWQIVYRTAADSPELDADQDDSGSQ